MCVSGTDNGIIGRRLALSLTCGHVKEKVFLFWLVPSTVATAIMIDIWR